MSNPKNKPPLIVTPDGATIIKPMTLSGVVRTKRAGTEGFAVVMATLAPDGTVQSIKVGNTQLGEAARPFVAREHHRSLGGLANKA